jgi:hypothetical protein
MKTKFIHCQTCGAHVSTQDASALCPHCGGEATAPAKSLRLGRSGLVSKLLGVTLAVSISASSGCIEDAEPINMYGGGPINNRLPDSGDDADAADEAADAEEVDMVALPPYGIAPLDMDEIDQPDS